MTYARKLMTAALIGTMTMGSIAIPAQSHSGYSKAYCRDYAKRVANDRAHPAGVLAGTAVGAGMGFILGRIIGGKRGGAVGAIGGGVGGAALTGIHTSKKWHRTYDQAYAYCRSR